MDTAFPNTRASAHPLAAVALARLRAANTPSSEFRQALHELALVLLVEALADLPLAATTITTPLAPADGARLAAPVAFVPILRAGLGLLPAALALVPTAAVCPVGLYRDEATLQPVSYYEKLPDFTPQTASFILDPMLATGGSALATARLLARHGAHRISAVSVLAAPEGLRLLQAEAPDVRVYTAAIDSHLDARGFIVPGLGDAGDRQFGG